MKITPLIASRFVSDGGSMFGLVPKPIWSKLIPPNDRNGIAQNANVLLVEWADGRRGLIDTGCGDPSAFTDKELTLHGMTRDWPLITALRNHNLSPADLDIVVLTHLHWDHAGGVGAVSPDGRVTPTFPNAVHYVHEQEWEDALSGDPLLYKSYPADTIEPLRRLPDTQRVLVRDGAPDILPGLRMVRSGGHTRGHCVIHLESDALEVAHADADAFGSVGHLMFMGDVCPTQHHLRLVFQTAYDTYPLETRRWKREWLPRAAREGIALFFDHDPDDCAVLIRADERKEYVVTRSIRAGG
jgi:glyoxylase-like metal-dependent hydrolase (beta-lactamase superfamily II)